MTASQATPRVWGIVPAAGMSRRMGFTKQTADIGGSTMVAKVAGTMLDAGVAGVVVVTRTELSEALALPADDRVKVAFNDDADSEMIDSIRIGLARLTDVRDDDSNVRANRDGVMVVPADMPTLAVSTCRACIASFLQKPDRIVIATHQGKRGHPNVFSLSVRNEATRLDGGLKMLAQIYPERVVSVETHDPGTTTDVDTPGDYHRL